MNLHQTVPVSNPLRMLIDEFGQSVWLDYIARNMLNNGELKELVEKDGLRGMTSNPAIFEKAIDGSNDYDEAIKELLSHHDYDPGVLFEKLAIEDILKATQILEPVYKSTNGRDGYVSIEVSPYLAYDTDLTIKEARRLWSSINRPNLMVKVPATQQGIPAISKLIGEGININITLLFSQEVYQQVIEAYISGLEILDKAGGDISKIASVASFFVSRIDTAIDTIIIERLKLEKDPAKIKKLTNIQGKVAIANAKLAYKLYKNAFAGKRWEKLAAKGAQTQRLLWASTGTKNPAYPDTLYVDELIGADTVNTIPPATFNAFRDHGKVGATLESDIDAAKQTIANLASLEISLSQVTNKLVKDGVIIFADAADKLLGAVSKKREELLKNRLNQLSYVLDSELNEKVEALLEDWRSTGKTRRLWACDSSLWTGTDESNWLGWLDTPIDELTHVADLKHLMQEVTKEKFKYALLMGMGGSSLGPEVMRLTFGKNDQYPDLKILDSTDPVQIKTIADEIDYKNTLFIVSSKSGSTLEPNILKQYFYEHLKETSGASNNTGQQFIAITDPGSSMEKTAEQDQFRKIYYGIPSIGGRYSVLSNFGMVPSAVMGIDVSRFLESAQLMMRSCSASVPPKSNPGVILGTILGAATREGRNKVTIITSPTICAIGAWLEQLLAESTGKNGKGLIPINDELLGPPSVYGNDRIFIYIKHDVATDNEQEAEIKKLEVAGFPVIRILISDIYRLGQEFFRLEFATAVAGSIMGINAFNQPDVEASKIATRELTQEYEVKGKLPEEKPIFANENVQLFASKDYQDILDQRVGTNKTLSAYLKAHIEQIVPHDYFAILAYIPRNEKNTESLQTIRHHIRDTKEVATCLGFGPRFLHSTGQAYKGGPNCGVFLQLTCDDAFDLPVPQHKYTFGLVKAAQARGDFQVLAQRKRRVLQIHLAKDLDTGLSILQQSMIDILS